jgi:metallo-beta-lactamase family protein
MGTTGTGVRVTFLGAAQTVTGSKYLLESDGCRLLVDCGLFQGKKELRLLNWDRPPVEALDFILLTHAHIDHIGYLPRVVKEGFRGPIYCTPGTDELAKILLSDAATLQEEEAFYAQKVGSSKHTPPRPLYTRDDAKQVFPLLRPLRFHESHELKPGVRVTFNQAGHILGSATITLDIGGRRLSFSGDVGRYGMPILKDPEPLELGDLLLCEGTYGDRLHGEADLKGQLLGVIHEAIARGAPLLIPAFALGRTQTIMYLLSELEREGRIPALPVFVDSPMAANVSMLYRKYPENYDEEMRARLEQKESPLFTSRTVLCRTVQQSKEINSMVGTRVIISASGMLSGGRILHHLIHHLPDPDATILFAGYQAEGTRGARIQAGEPTVRVFGQDIPVRAHVRNISGLSAHADRKELVRWLRSCSGSPAQVRIVHAESSAGEALSATLTDEFGWRARPAEFTEVVDV